MKTIFKHSLFLVTAILAISLLNAPLCYCIESNTVEKGQSFATNVIGLDMSKYVLAQITSHRYPLGFGASDDEQITYTLDSLESKLELVCDFRDGRIVWAKIYPFKGTPHFVQPTSDPLEAAKAFMNRYQAYSKDAIPQTLLKMLNSVSEVKSTISIKQDNVVMLIAPQESGVVVFEWMNTVNGITNIYNRIGLSFQNGAFSHFSYNWNRYSVGSADVKFLREQAVDIAKERARTFSYGVGDLIVDNLVVVDAPFAELTMQPRANGLLYPHWEIYLTLDKVYPANVACLHIMMWADTGEISSIKATSTLGGFPSTIVEPSTPTESPDSTAKTEDSSASSVLVYLIAAAAVAITIPIAAVILKKRRSK